MLTFSRHRPRESRSVRNAFLKLNDCIRPFKSPFLIKRKTSESSGSIAETDKAGLLRKEPSYDMVCLKSTEIHGFWALFGRKVKDASNNSGISVTVSCVQSCDMVPILRYLRRARNVTVPFCAGR